MRMRATFTIFFITALVLVPVQSSAQGQKADYERAERFLPWNVRRLVYEADVTPHWLGETNRFWYSMRKRGGHEFVAIDPDRGTRENAFDASKLAASLSRALRREVKPEELPFDVFDFNDDNSAISFTVDENRWTCSLHDYECKRDQESAQRLRARQAVSPDGNWVALVKQYNLYIRSLANGQEIQLTNDGESNYDYATPLPSLSELARQDPNELYHRAVVYWSPDSKRLVAYRIDSRYSARFTSVQNAPPNQLRPIAYTYAYPLPGEMLATAEPFCFDLRSARRTTIETDPLEISFQGGPGFTWSKDNRHFRFNATDRGWRKIDVREADSTTGKVRTVISESSDDFIDPGATFQRFFNNDKELLWASERDGWNQLYLYDAQSGQLKNQVTKGPWLVRGIIHVDDKARQVYFTAAGREPNEDPYQQHLYRINLDGTNLRLLTPENANHTIAMSPAGAYFVDTYSRPDLPGVAVLRRSSDGSVVRELEKTDAEDLLKTGWKFPEAFHGIGADGKTDIYGLIWRPSNFDPSRKYPVLEQIYTGPQGFFVPKTFAAYRNNAQSTAELGFIVVMIDGFGTAGRSKAFHAHSYKNLGDGGVDDHIAVLRQMAAKYPYMDLMRVGLWGGSAGGYDSTHAMLTHPDFYKVAVSISGNHDHRMDKAWWNELWMGYPIGKNYKEQSNVTLAGNLKGKLLLIHGDMDDNVHPASTMQLVNALILANKNFDLLIVPNQGHGEGTNPYLIRRRWDYFVQNLLGVTPPDGFAIRRAGTGQAAETWNRP
jgi:dienelactone hydrolase